MRVIAGSAGGLQLKSPAGLDLRPTSDRVREALFEMLAARGVLSGTVLDLYSGTGALGIEALSRGAAHCDFVESSFKACRVLKANLEHTGLAQRATVHPKQVEAALQNLAGPFDLVVADPPYEYDRAMQELSVLAERELSSPGGLVAVEHSKRKEWPEELGDLKRALFRRYGDTCLSIYDMSEQG